MALRAQRPLWGREGHARVVVLSVIDEEFDALREELSAPWEIRTTGVFSPVDAGDDPSCVPFVLAQCPNRSNIQAQMAATRLIEQFQPEIVMLVGIAGGVQRPDVESGRIVWSGPHPGDIVVAQYVHYAPYAKHLASGHYPRYFPIDHPEQSLLSRHGRIDRLQSGASWYDSLPRDRPSEGRPEVHLGEIVAVESVTGDPDSEQQAELLRRYDNALAVDMESAGVGAALHDARRQVHYNPRWMCIRGVSDPVRSASEFKDFRESHPGIPPAVDLGDNDEERKRWKAYAAAVTARYAAIVLERLLSEPRLPVAKDQGAEAYAWRAKSLGNHPADGRTDDRG